MDLESFKCPKCDYVHSNLDSLRIHWQKIHDEPSLNLRIALFGRPLCECGCGGETRFMSLQRGFSRFVNSHNNRVNNNWGHNKEAKQKSQDTRREMWKNGEIKGWAHGKPADHPQNVARRENMRQTILNDPEARLQRSVLMSKYRKDGTIPTKYGKESSQWKGGTSALQPLARSRLFSVWTYPKLKASDFTCYECGSKKDLEVHHDQERFAAILIKAIETLGEPGDDFDRKTALVDWVAQYHVDNDVSGIVLCEQCHEIRHQGVV